MRKDGYLCSTITVKIRFKDFKTITRQKKTNSYFESDDIIFEIAKNLFQTNNEGKEIRLLGVSASGLVRRNEIQDDTFFPIDAKENQFIGVIDSIKDRFGEDSIRRCATVRR